MKRHGNLWQDVISMDTLRMAHQMAKKGKGHYTDVKLVESDVDGHLKQIQDMLANKTFTTGEYKIQDRMEGGKMRRIYKLPYFPDRIVQHALLSVIGPIFRRSMIRDTFQSLPGRGTSDARRRVQQVMKTDAPRYALKVDIRKYYPSVQSDLMKQAVRHKIKCADTLWLIDDIIDSMEGLPIGNLSSQYFGNVFLTKFDWWVKQTLGVKHYYRYCDDMVLMSNDKAQLRQWRKEIAGYLGDIGLTLKPDWQIYDVHRQGLDFVGYVFFPVKTRLRASIATNFRRHTRRSRQQNITTKATLDGLAAYKGWVMRSSGKRLWRQHVTHQIIKSCDGIYRSNPIRGAI